MQGLKIDGRIQFLLCQTIAVERNCSIEESQDRKEQSTVVAAATVR